MIIGKVVGFFSALLAGWYPLGAFIGFLGGALWDWFLSGPYAGMRAQDEGHQELSTLILQLAALVAKADGRMSKEEMRAVRACVYLSPEDDYLAGIIMRQEKKYRQKLPVLVARVQEMCQHDDALLAQIMRMLCLVGIAEGTLHPATGNLLGKIGHVWGYKEDDLARYLRQEFQQQGNPTQEEASAHHARTEQAESQHREEERFQSDGNPHVKQAFGEKDPYKLIGVKKDVDAAALKKAYRTLVQKHHPDRVRAEGGNEAAVKKAEATMAEINAAYSYIQKQIRR